MGNDGGSIPKREELVKLKQKKQQADKDEQNRSKWRLCALSKQVLEPPIVACKLGYLYNKTAVLESLLDGSLPPEFSHIRKAKRDLINLNLHSIEGEKKFVCPVTGLTMGGNYKFIAIVPCGCVIAERAFKEIPDQNICLNCSKKYDKEKDILPLNGTQEEINKRKEELKASKKSTGKKRKSSSKSTKKPPKKVQKINTALGPLIASSDVKSHMPKDANPEIYNSLFTSSVKDVNNDETFCCRNAAHRLG